MPVWDELAIFSRQYDSAFVERPEAKSPCRPAAIGGSELSGPAETYRISAGISGYASCWPRYEL